MDSPDQTQELPPLGLRTIGPTDKAFLEELHTPEVQGDLDTYDDAEPMLDGRHYNGGGRIIELPDGTPVGQVSWIQVPHGPNQRSLVWVIGIVLLPSHRGNGFGASAQKLLAQQLLNESEANRVEASTDVENLGEQRSLSLAGFTDEGIRRGALWRGGKWHDQVIYSRLRVDQ